MSKIRRMKKVNRKLQLEAVSYPPWNLRRRWSLPTLAAIIRKIRPHLETVSSSRLGLENLHPDSSSSTRLPSVCRQDYQHDLNWASPFKSSQTQFPWIYSKFDNKPYSTLRRFAGMAQHYKQILPPWADNHQRSWWPLRHPWWSQAYRHKATIKHQHLMISKNRNWYRPEHAKDWWNNNK